MTEIVSLVQKPTVTEEIRSNVVNILRETLEQAERGEIDTVIMILHHPDGDWTDRASSTEIFSDSIGRLEILKQKWISNYNVNPR